MRQDQNQYQSQELASLLESLKSQQANGVLYLEALINPRQKRRTCIFGLKNGGITYGGSKLPNNDEFVHSLVYKYKPDLIKVALGLAKQKVTHQNSTRELLEQLVKMRMLTWEQVETQSRAQTVLVLEQVLPYPGQFRLDRDNEFDLCHQEACLSLDWSQLMAEVARRREEWTMLAPLISSMYAVPQLKENALPRITDSAVRQHLQQWVNGQRSLVEIAENIQKDPLQVARQYLEWTQMEWVTFGHSRASSESNPQLTILSVDDSPIVQITIKRALGDRYNVLLANNAVDALQILNQKQVSLLLLDVTMPDIDGLEMCRTLRSVPKFRDLPVIMLTARDGWADKLKGQIAGTNHYLTKPFDTKKLLEIVSQYANRDTTSVKAKALR